MATLALVVAIVLFVLATFTDGIAGLSQPELAYFGLAFVAFALLGPALPAYSFRRGN